MPAKTTTQILAIRWQDRAWRPRIRRTGPAGSPATGTSMSARGRAVAAMADLRDPAPPCAAKAPAGFVRRMFLALRPRRKRSSL